MNREQKAEVISTLKTKADTASIAVVSDFKGLSVAEMTELRIALREAGVDFQVVKNTLARQAFAQSPHAVIADSFKECCAIAFGSEDPVAAAKVLNDFAKKNDKLSLRFASLEGSLLDAAAVSALAKLPGKQELLGKLLGTMNAVPTNFVCLFANMQRKFLYALSAIKEQKETA